MVYIKIVLVFQHSNLVSEHLKMVSNFSIIPDDEHWMFLLLTNKQNHLQTCM